MPQLLRVIDGVDLRDPSTRDGEGDRGYRRVLLYDKHSRPAVEGHDARVVDVVGRLPDDHGGHRGGPVDRAERGSRAPGGIGAPHHVRVQQLDKGGEITAAGRV